MSERLVSSGRRERRLTETKEESASGRTHDRAKVERGSWESRPDSARRKWMGVNGVGDSQGGGA